MSKNQETQGFKKLAIDLSPEHMTKLKANAMARQIKVVDLIREFINSLDNLTIEIKVAKVD